MIMAGKKFIRAIDLFAGIGGIRLGFEQAFGKRFKTIFVSEFDKAANRVYEANFHDEFPISGDITKIDEKDIPPFDVCLAGFPCQAFSIAGYKMGFDDNYKDMSRGTLFREVVRICEYHRPKVIFCENVKGLAIHDKGRTLAVIKGAFQQIGYDVYINYLKSQDYGVPQTRERTYIVCVRKDLHLTNFFWPERIETENNCLANVLEKEPVSAKYYLSTVYLECLERHRAKHMAAGHGFGYKIRPLDGYAGTLVCGGMGKERNLIIDKRLTDFTPVTRIKGPINQDYIRRLTPREWARLQGFPDTYLFPEGDAPAYKQLGNSVTISVIKAIAAELKKQLNL